MKRSIWKSKQKGKLNVIDEDGTFHFMKKERGEGLFCVSCRNDGPTDIGTDGYDHYTFKKYRNDTSHSTVNIGSHGQVEFWPAHNGPIVFNDFWPLKFLIVGRKKERFRGARESDV